MTTQLMPPHSESAESTLLTARSWEEVVSSYRSSDPFNFAVLDEALDEDSTRALWQRLVEHWGWHYKNWIDRHLMNVALGDIPEVAQISRELKAVIPDLLDGLELVDVWAIRQHQNAGLNPHADNAAVVFSLWLTPVEFNCHPESGGLVLFDVKRTDDMLYHEFASNPWCEQTYRRLTKGGATTIAYGWNRAVLLDGRTFHATDRLCFETTRPDGHRINLTFAFENPAALEARLRQYSTSTGAVRI